MTASPLSWLPWLQTKPLRSEPTIARGSGVRRAVGSVHCDPQQRFCLFCMPKAINRACQFILDGAGSSPLALDTSCARLTLIKRRFYRGRYRSLAP